MEKIASFDKVLEVAASGIGAVAGPMLAPWKARREGLAKIEAAKADSKVLSIQTEAHRKAQTHLQVTGLPEAVSEFAPWNLVSERIRYQENKRHANIQSVLKKALFELETKVVPDTEPNHDWTARFFNDVQDVSSEEMQILWAKVLSGEIERPGSTGIRTLSCLRELDRETAKIFARFCSACIYVVPELGRNMIDARVSSLDGWAGGNSLEPFGFNFVVLNRLSEYGLICPHFETSKEYDSSVWSEQQKPEQPTFPIRFQEKTWLFKPTDNRTSVIGFRIRGPILSLVGKELSKVVEYESMPEYSEQLQIYLLKKKIRMIQVQK